MFDLILSRMYASPGLAARILMSSVLIMALDLASAVYVMLLFKQYGQAGFQAFAVSVTGGLVIVMAARLTLAKARHRATTLLFAGGTEGDLWLALLPLSIGAQKRQGAISATESIIAANSPGNFIAVVELPTAIVFVALIHVVAGMAAGAATAAVLLCYVLFHWTSSRRTLRLTQESLRAKTALTEALEKARALAAEEGQNHMNEVIEGARRTETEAIAAGKTRETLEPEIRVMIEAAKAETRALAEGIPDAHRRDAETAILSSYDVRARMDAAAAGDRNMNVLFTGLVLVGAVGIGALFGEGHAGGTGALIAGNILAGRALAVLTAGLSAMAMFHRVQPMLAGLLSELHSVGLLKERRSSRRTSDGERRREA
jgi:hypothetical protein